MSNFNNKHLLLEDRLTIQKGLHDGLSKSAIARNINKHRSTVCKEVNNHKYIYKKKFSRKTIIHDCLYLNECGLKYCDKPCGKYVMMTCTRRDKIGVCNGCSEFSSCRLTKYHYDATKSFKTYRETLSDSREGVNLTTSQAKELGDFIKPLISNGISPYAITLNNRNIIGICEKTLYNYLDQGVFSQNGLYNLDLRRKVSMKIRKAIKSKPRESRSYLKNRMYRDFELYKAQTPNTSIVEMDTVYNDVSNGPFIQTFYLVNYDILIALYHENKTAETMFNGVKLIKSMIGEHYFNKYFGILLTDRGSEFSKADEIENLGTKVFYCDPMCSWQKPNVENSHLRLRYILPKEKDLFNLGLQSQEDLNLIISHINSYSVESLFGKNPIETFAFFQPDERELLTKLGIMKIDPNDINLTPSLIKKTK